MIQLNSQWYCRSKKAPKKSDLRKFVHRAAEVAGLPVDPAWSCNILFVGDRRMAQMNMDLLGHEGTTDVITFCYFEEGMPIEKGETMVELIVNPEAAAREGEKRPGGYCREVALYIVHGMLHSAGEDDLEETVRRRMRRRERECMSILENEFDLALLFPGA
jgi:probable rRNA maturation factor